MTEFTPWASLAGGVLIGLAAVLLMLTEGRIAGISGIASRLLDKAPGQAGRWAFVTGLVLTPFVYAFFAGKPQQTLSGGWLLMAIGGLLVGFGSVFGNGCTSGHGVCGLARLSPRSLVATGIFMTTAVLTVFILRHVGGK